MSSFLSYLLPQKLAEFSTKYNKHIRVNDEFGQRKLLVNGSVQSGRYVRSLWKRAFKVFGIPKNKQWNIILVLGVGGGTVIELLHSQFPNALITGVDIDRLIIDIAKKYFLHGDTPYLHLVTADAKKYMQKSSSTYDCIVIDIFTGNAIPQFVKTNSFITYCKQRLSPKGVICINYLQDREYGEKSDELNKALCSMFRAVQDFRIANNRFFFASIV